MFSIWVVLALFGAIKYLGWKIGSLVSWGQLTFIAISIQICYSCAVSVLQYVTWKTSDMGTIFTQAFLPKETPFPVVLEGARFLFEREHGYFAFYVYTHFFLSSVILFFIVGFFILLLVLLRQKVPLSFKQNDIWIAAFSCVVVGWPRVLLFIPVAFLVLIIRSVLQTLLKKGDQVYLSEGFILLIIPILIFGNQILQFFNLYTLLTL